MQTQQQTNKPKRKEGVAQKEGRKKNTKKGFLPKKEKGTSLTIKSFKEDVSIA
jgi:hypothetical protein